MSETIAYRISEGANQELLDRLHATALRVLEEVGVAVLLPELLQAIDERPGFSVRNGVVRIKPERVEACIVAMRQQTPPPPPEDDFRISILNGYAFQNLDIRDDTLRPFTTEDCIRMAGFVDGLHDCGVSGGSPGLPHDVPVALREVLAYKIGAEHSRTSDGVGVTSLAGAEAIRQMAEVLGRSFGQPIFLLDPLTVGGDSLSMALHFARMDPAFAFGVSTMPLLGVTCPLPLPGAFAENIATVLGGCTLLHALEWPNPMRCHFDVYPFDMQTGTVAYGTPEHIRMHLLGTEINRYYGAYSHVCKAFHTNAVHPDAHSTAQRAAFAMAAALHGAREYTFGGMLGIDKIFSAEQLLVDIEILRHVRAATAPIPFAPEEDFDAIRKIGPGGDYLTHPSTLAGMGGLSRSALFQNVSPELWIAEKRDDLKERLRHEAERIQSCHYFELPRDQQYELDRIYRKFSESAAAR